MKRDVCLLTAAVFSILLVSSSVSGARPVYTTTTSLPDCGFERSWYAYDPVVPGGATSVSSDSNGNAYVLYMLDSGAQSPIKSPVLVKYGPDGTKAFEKRLTSGEPSVGRGVGASPDGGAYVVGEKNSQLWLLKVGSDGDILWEKNLPQADRDGHNGVDVEVASEGLYVVGQHRLAKDIRIMKLGFDGGTVWEKTYVPPKNSNLWVLGWKAATAQDGGAYVVGTLGNHTLSSQKALLLRYLPDGELAWNRTYSAKNQTYDAYGVASSQNGSVYVAGTFNNKSSGDIPFIIKYSDKGQLVSRKVDDHQPTLLGIKAYDVLAGAKEIYLLESDPSRDRIVVVKYGLDGDITCAHVESGAMAYGRDMSSDGPGKLFVVGSMLSGNVEHPSAMKLRDPGAGTTTTSTTASISTTTLKPALIPDLKVESVAWAPKNPSANAKTGFTITVANQGKAAGSIGSVALYIDHNLERTVDLSGVKIKPGKTTTLMPNGLQGLTLSQGSHSVKVVVDANDITDESDEGNNEFSGKVTVSKPLKPDLVLEEVSYTPSAPVSSSRVSVTLRVSNNGEGPSRIGRIKAELDGSVLGVWDYKIPIINPKQTVTIKPKDLRLLKLGKGKHELIIYIDSRSEIDETRENNNQLTKTITVN